MNTEFFRLILSILVVKRSICSMSTLRNRGQNPQSSSQAKIHSHVKWISLSCLVYVDVLHALCPSDKPTVHATTVWCKLQAKKTANLKYS